jgi:hypothetical protein
VRRIEPGRNPARRLDQAIWRRPPVTDGDRGWRRGRPITDVLFSAKLDPHTLDLDGSVNKSVWAEW